MTEQDHWEIKRRKIESKKGANFSEAEEYKNANKTLQY